MAKREVAQMDAWSRELRNHGSLGMGSSGGQRGSNPMLSARRESSRENPSTPRSTGSNNSLTKLLAITKDHESMCSHLLSTARTLDEQIRSLRAEHESLRVEAQAMRRCLDRAGVLPTSDLEKEIEHCTPAVPSPPATASTAYLESSPSNATASPPGGAAAAGTLQRAEGQQASWPSLPVEGDSLGLHSSSASTPSLSGQGSNPPTRAEEPAEDLYDLTAPLLDGSSSMAEQQRALRNVQRHLKEHPEPPNSWRGPGTPLGSAVKASRVDLARLLLRARANANERDAKGVSALHLATFDGNAEICRALLVARADVDSHDRHGQTSLFFAPTREVCKLLVEKRADVTVLNRKGQSALHLAGRAGLQEVLAWLSTRVSKQVLELKDIHGATARYYAAQSGGCPPLPEDKPAGKSRGVPSSGSSAGAMAVAQLTNEPSHTLESPLQDSSPAMAGIEVGQLPSVSEIIEEGRSSQEQSPDVDSSSAHAQAGRRDSLPSVSMIVEAPAGPHGTSVRALGSASGEEEASSLSIDTKKDVHLPISGRPKSASAAPAAYPVKSWSQKSAQVVVPAATRRNREMPKAAPGRPAERSTTPSKIQTPRAGDSPASNHSNSRDSPAKRAQLSAAPSPAKVRTPVPARSNGEVRTGPSRGLPPAAQPSGAPALKTEKTAVSVAGSTEAPAPVENAMPSQSSLPAAEPSTAHGYIEPEPVDHLPKTLGTVEASTPSEQAISPGAQEFSICDEESPRDAVTDMGGEQWGEKRSSLEVMYEEGFETNNLNRVNEPNAVTEGTPPPAVGSMVKIGDRIGHVTLVDSSDLPLKVQFADGSHDWFKTEHVLIMPSPKESEVDKSLQDAGVIESDDTGAFDSLTLRPQEAVEDPHNESSSGQPVPSSPSASKADKQGTISAEEAAALAEAGVFDGDLEDEVGFNIKDANVSPTTNKLNQEDLAAIGVLGEDDMSMLNSPHPQDAADLAEVGVFCDDAADMAALAEAGVLEFTGEDDLDALAEAGVYDRDDSALEEAGIFLGPYEERRNRRLSAVQEEVVEEDEEDGYDEEEEEAEDEEEEEEFDGDEVDDDDLEEAW